MKSKELLLDAFGRIREAVAATLDGVDGDALLRRPAGNGNSVAWLVWHLSRVEDAQLAGASGLEQVWTAQGFVGRFDLPLPEGDTGYGHSSEKVDAVKVPAELLLEYYDAVHRQSVAFLQSLGDEDMDRVIDTRWNPPVTLAVRLVSTIADCLQHAGQAAYAKGLDPARTL
ncbi:DUF664 domain-containing protein [Micrococcaceae bacterium Sec5.8]